MNNGLEIWGGLECTLNRVREQYFDQLAFSGHYDREDDLDRIAALGIRTLRYPILWERWGTEADWTWLDRRLNRLRDLGVRVVAGLVHHGSGPAQVSLTDPAFANGLAEFAARVASRYPWLEDYTPVNEPLTTARFSGLYGHWYPHGRDDRQFVLALYHQVLATGLAMAAIRQVCPSARLIQTEDLGKVTSVPELAYQASWENERRWLSFDLLCGRVGREHRLYGYLRENGLSPTQLAWLRNHPCAPQILGLNYYVTSERFLDTDLTRHPPHTHGGNGRHSYADVEAVRWGRWRGIGPLLKACWTRYQLPIAITEAHLGCTREEQMRWLLEIWRKAGRARRRGIDLRAVTSWALLGGFDWNSLVTRPVGYYEPGAFDVRAPRPRATALAHLISDLAQKRPVRAPYLRDRGWWRTSRPLRSRPLLVAGDGRLGQVFARLCELRGLACVVLGRGRLELSDADGVASALAELRPWAVINTAGYRCVDRAESDPGACRRDNFESAVALARACARSKLPMLTLSSELVFDGRAEQAYREGDPANPLNVYGQTKRAAEEAVLELHPGALVVRTGGLFGLSTDPLSSALRSASRGYSVGLAGGVVSPTYASDLGHACLDLLLDGECGLWHLVNRGRTSWLELARQAASLVGIDGHYLREGLPDELGWVAQRPLMSALCSRRGQLLPALEDALERCLRHEALR